MANKGKVEFKRKPIENTAIGPWSYPFLKLKAAQNGISMMNAFKDKVSFLVGWLSFVDSLEQSYSAFYEEVKQRCQSKIALMQEFDKLRHHESLLKYLIQVRHKSQHGQFHLEWEEPKLEIGKDFYGRISSLVLHPDGSFTWKGETFPGEKELGIGYEDWKPRLPAITNRGGRFEVPNLFLGKKVDNDPVDIAERALSFYDHEYQRIIAEIQKTLHGN